jgi:hypothetical protein
VVAKGVSPPEPGLWLPICLFSNKSAALPGRAFVFYGIIPIHNLTVRLRTLITKTNTTEISGLFFRTANMHILQRVNILRSVGNNLHKR